MYNNEAVRPAVGPLFVYPNGVIKDYVNRHRLMVGTSIPRAERPPFADYAPLHLDIAGRDFRRGCRECVERVLVEQYEPHDRGSTVFAQEGSSRF